MAERSQLVRRYFEAYRTRDRAVMEAALAKDFTFTSPYDDAIDRAAYFERCWPGGDQFKDMAVDRVVEDGDACFVLYRCETIDGKSFRNVELHRFEGDRLNSVEVYFGAAWKDGVFQKQQ
jgi:ketosteroid isomerase-like protein